MSRDNDIRLMLAETSDIALSAPDLPTRLHLLTFMRDEVADIWNREGGRLLYNARTRTPRPRLVDLQEMTGLGYLALTGLIDRYAEDHGLPKVGVPSLDGNPVTLGDSRLVRGRRVQ